MKFTVIGEGLDSMLKVDLEAEEKVLAESGAMVSTTSNVLIEASAKGGVLGSLARKFLTGESFFVQSLKAQGAPGSANLAPASPGEIKMLKVDTNNGFYLQKGAFLASSKDVQVKTQMQNLSKGLFGGEGFFILKTEGEGDLAIGSFGKIFEIDLAPGETQVVDNGHLVAWSMSTKYSIDWASTKGFWESFKSGENLVCVVEGPGKIYIQSRNERSFANWMMRFLPKTGNS